MDGSKGFEDVLTGEQKKSVILILTLGLNIRPHMGS
jgi:hypothetical protein